MSRSTGRSCRRARWRFGAVVAVVLLAAACSGSPPTSGGTNDVGLAHVHGLGVNPADGRLYVATHHGVFRVGDGTAERAGSLIQDTMGFTVAGADRFLGSGHPDIRSDTILDENMRPLLGLIESTNRAQTWEGLSLQGEVDFHALAFAHNRIYGFDATGGRFMVSADNIGWETRSQVELLSFTVSPTEPDRIIATTYDVAVVASDDGGRTWQPAEGSPKLAFVSWDDKAGLWGIGEGGTVLVSSDKGATWVTKGKVAGEPAALLAHPDGLFAATSEAVYSSTDQGATWTTLYEIT